MKPNIVITIADDQQASAIGALGVCPVQTPALDSMVKEGVCFRQAHHFGSSHAAVCAPSRAMLHTGRNYFSLPGPLCTDWQREMPDEQYREALGGIPMLGELLGQHGYRTFATGKWHNGAPAFHKSFQDGANIFLGGMCDHDQVPLHAYDPTGEYPKDQLAEAEGFSTDLFCDAALEYLDRLDGDAPFFLYVAFTAPHDPRTPLPQYDRMYRRQDMPIPPNFLPEHPFDNGDFYVRDELLADWPRTEERVKQELGDYYGMITHMDHAIGKIRDALAGKAKLAKKKAGRHRLENTIFIHTADHGLALGQHGLMGKQNLYEHSVRVPLLMTGPDIENRTVDALVYQHDLFATVLEAAGIDVPEACEFQSLWPLIRGRSDSGYPTIMSSYMDGQRMIKDPQYKLIRYTSHDGVGVDKVQLFDHVADPYETVDLAEDSEHAGRVDELSKELDRRMVEVGDSLCM